MVSIPYTVMIMIDLHGKILANLFLYLLCGISAMAWEDWGCLDRLYRNRCDRLHSNRSSSDLLWTQSKCFKKNLPKMKVNSWHMNDVLKWTMWLSPKTSSWFTNFAHARICTCTLTHYALLTSYSISKSLSLSAWSLSTWLLNSDVGMGFICSPAAK